MPAWNTDRRLLKAPYAPSMNISDELEQICQQDMFSWFFSCNLTSAVISVIFLCINVQQPGDFSPSAPFVSTVAPILTARPLMSYGILFYSRNISFI